MYVMWKMHRNKWQNKEWTQKLQNNQENKRKYINNKQLIRKIVEFVFFLSFSGISTKIFPFSPNFQKSSSNFTGFLVQFCGFQWHSNIVLRSFPSKHCSTWFFIQLWVFFLHPRHLSEVIHRWILLLACFHELTSVTPQSNITEIHFSIPSKSEPLNFRQNNTMATTRLIRFPKTLLQSIRTKSTKTPTLTAMGHQSHVQKVVTTSDGNAFVAWHPTVDFPYEHSLPIPPAAIPTSSLIKDQAIDTAMAAFGQKKMEIAREELMRITHSHCITWAPRQRDRKAKKTPMDREYL